MPVRGQEPTRGTMLLFRLAKPGRLEITVFGPGPLCNRQGTFARRGRPGMNRLLFSGRVNGRALPAGRYAVVVEVVRGTSRVRLGRVPVRILPRDGREGGSRPLAPPDCSVVVYSSSAAAGYGALGAGSPDSGVAGVSAARGEPRADSGFPSLPIAAPLPPLPPLANINPGTVVDLLESQFLPAFLGLLAGAVAAAVGYGVRRHWESRF